MALMIREPQSKRPRNGYIGRGKHQPTGKIGAWDFHDTPRYKVHTAQILKAMGLENEEIAEMMNPRKPVSKQRIDALLHHSTYQNYRLTSDELAAIPIEKQERMKVKRKRGRKISRTRLAARVSERFHEISLGDIAHELGVPLLSIRQAKSKMGIKTPRTGEMAANYSREHPLELYTRVARQFGISPKGLSKARKKAGLKPLSPSLGGVRSQIARRLRGNRVAHLEGTRGRESIRGTMFTPDSTSGFENKKPVAVDWRTPAERAIRREREEIVSEALEKLSQVERQVIENLGLHDYNPAMIPRVARELGLSEEKTRNALASAFSKLRQNKKVAELV